MEVITRNSERGRTPQYMEIIYELPKPFQDRVTLIK